MCFLGFKNRSCRRAPSIFKCSTFQTWEFFTLSGKGSTFSTTKYRKMRRRIENVILTRLFGNNLGERKIDFSISISIFRESEFSWVLLPLLEGSFRKYKKRSLYALWTIIRIQKEHLHHQHQRAAAARPSLSRPPFSLRNAPVLSS